MKLVYGVVDIPYVTLSPSQKGSITRKRKKNPGYARALTQTTGDVATILEDKYGVFETFHYMHEEDVADVLEGRLEGALENALMGHRASLKDIFSELSPLEEVFRRAIDQREFDGIIAGVPTKASLAGVNHRLKHPNAKDNPVRPSFIDTGLYRASAKVYITK